ncbi:YfhO family protein, partial [Patescibacteria group bacterium]|nr:YfhO family protein [Patescibacteria group bacterium]
MAKIKKFWPFFFILFLVVLFFWKYFLKGFIPVPGDFVVGVYYPWLDYNWGYLAGIPVKNPLLADVPSLIYPLKSYAVDLLKSGIWPLWNPLQFGGYPLLANFQTGALNPANLIYFILPKIHAWSFQIILQPFLIVSFTFLFLRNLRLSKISSLFGGIVFAFSGFSMIWLEYNTHGFAICFIPLLLLLTDKWLEEKKILWGGLFSLFLAFQIFSGYPQVALYTLFLIFFYFWFRRGFKINKTIFREGMVFGLWIFLGMCLSAIQIIPGWELLSLSQRAGEGVSGGFEVAFLPWKQLVTLIAPDFFGNPATYNYWGPGNYTNGVGYSGLIPLFLSLFISFGRRKQRIIYFFALVFFFSLILALPTFVAQFISSSGLLGSKAVCATRVLCLANFSVAILSAFAIEKILKKQSFNFKMCLTPLIVVSGIFIGVFTSFKMISLSLVSFPEGLGREFLLPWEVNLKVAVRNFIFPFSLSALFSGLCFFSRFKSLSKLVVFAIFFLMVFELFRFGWKFTPFTDPVLIYPSTPVLEYLKKVDKPTRINTGDAIPISMWIPYGLESSSGYDAVYPLRWAQFLSAVNGGEIIRPMGRYGPIHKYNSRLFDLSNNCY